MSSHLKYRADIDGLRAIAVLGVVIFHAFPQNLPGGFCGVDIFFVISGYLISGILYKGVKEGGFTFREFYARRVRRLFPSLITVMLLCLGYGYFVLLEDEYQQLGKHVAAGTVFIQNFVFWKESGYWDVASSLKPLLHLWSLAVEEQFYIIFPPLLLLFWKKKWPMVPLLWILLTASLIANLVMSTQDRSSDFYLTSYRAWEFLAGSLLAWWHYGKNHEEEAPYGNALAMVGVILLAASMILLKEKEPYPGWRAIFPVAGSVTLIAAGKGSWINRTILSHPIMVWIGLISYPLYLFHWPALSFVHIIKGEKPADIYIAAALAVAFLLTVATYYIVERPLRVLKSRATVPTLTWAFIATGCVGVLVWINAISVNRKTDMDRVKKINEAIKDRNYFEGYERIRPKGSSILLFNAGGGRKEILFLGDSNMQMYAPRVLSIIKKQNDADFGVIFISHGAASPIPGIVSQERPEGAELIPLFYDTLEKNSSVKKVVIASYWSGCFGVNSTNTFHGKLVNSVEGKKAAMESLGKLIRGLVARNIEVTLFLGIPVGMELEPKSFFKRTFMGISFGDKPTLTKMEYLNRNADLISDLKSVALNNGANVVDPVEALCNGNLCISETEEGPIRFDYVHLRATYVRDHVKYLDQIIVP